VSRFVALLLNNIMESEAHNFDRIIKLTEQAVQTLYALVETGLAHPPNYKPLLTIQIQADHKLIQ